MTPGSTGIVVDIAPVQGTGAPKMPNRQVGLGLNRMAQHYTFAHELLQQCIDGDALAAGFVSNVRLGFARYFDTHGVIALRWTSKSLRSGQQSSPQRRNRRLTDVVAAPPLTQVVRGEFGFSAHLHAARLRLLAALARADADKITFASRQSALDGPHQSSV
jgi:hypothetical protein